MHSASQGKQSLARIGAKDVSASITLPPAVHTAHERSSGLAQVQAAAPPPKAGKSRKSASNTIGTMVTASMGRSVAIVTCAALAKGPTPSHAVMPGEKVPAPSERLAC